MRAINEASDFACAFGFHSVLDAVPADDVAWEFAYPETDCPMLERLPPVPVEELALRLAFVVDSIIPVADALKEVAAVSEASSAYTDVFEFVFVFTEAFSCVFVLTDDFELLPEENPKNSPRLNALAWVTPNATARAITLVPIRVFLVVCVFIVFIS